MRNKLLLVYGYALPFLASAVVSALPLVVHAITYDAISQFFKDSADLVLAFVALLAGVTFPFQSAIIQEENPHVLEVMGSTGIRRAYVRASVFQAVTILVLVLAMLLLMSAPAPNTTYGWLELWLIALATFESMSLITNGRDYNRMRERIISETEKALRKKK